MVKGKLPVMGMILILVIYVYFGVNYLSQRGAQQRLASQVSEITQTLAEIPRPAQDLEQRLETARTSLEAERGVLPEELNGIEAVSTILELAGECQVRAIPLATQPWSIRKIGQHSYHVLELKVTVDGSFPQILSFLSRLEKGEFNSLVIQNLNLEKVRSSEEGTASDEAIPVVGSLNLAIFAQSPASE